MYCDMNNEWFALISKYTIPFNFLTRELSWSLLKDTIYLLTKNSDEISPSFKRDLSTTSLEEIMEDIWNLKLFNELINLEASVSEARSRR